MYVYYCQPFTPQVRNQDERYLSFSRNSPKRGSYLLPRRRVPSKYYIEGKGDIELEERNSRPWKGTLLNWKKEGLTKLFFCFLFTGLNAIETKKGTYHKVGSIRLKLL